MKFSFIGLSEAVRAEVILTSELDDIWQRADFTNPDVVTWRLSFGLFRSLFILLI